MNIMKRKLALASSSVTPAKSSAIRNVAEKTSPTGPRRAVEKPRGIYSATRNLDSNFRC